VSLPTTTTWVDARSAAEAVALLHQHGPRAVPLAAGGDLFGLMKEGIHDLARPVPTLLVNLGRAADLHGIQRSAEGWRLGAMLTLATLADASGLPPMLAQAVGRIASPQLRQRTTLGGNLLQRPRCLWFRHAQLHCFKKGAQACLAQRAPPEAYPGALFPGRCHAGHPSDLAPVLMALEAEAELIGPHGMRRLPLEQLFDGAGNRPDAEAALRPGEVLVALHLPDDHRPQAFEKLAARDANEFSWASLALRLMVDDAAVIRSARVVLGGIAPGPWRWPAAAHHLAAPPLAALARRDLDVLARTMLPDSPVTMRHRARTAAARTALQRALRQLLPSATA